MSSLRFDREVRATVDQGRITTPVTLQQTAVDNTAVLHRCVAPLDRGRQPAERSKSQTTRNMSAPCTFVTCAHSNAHTAPKLSRGTESAAFGVMGTETVLATKHRPQICSAAKLN